MESGIDEATLRGGRQSNEICRARQVAMYLAVKHCKSKKMRELAADFDKERSTVTHGSKNIEKAVRTDARVRMLIRRVEEWL